MSEVVQYSSSSWSSFSNMLLQSHSSMSSLSLASPWFINDKHASVHYLFAAVQNVRCNLSDTLVTIDTMFRSINMLHWTHTRSKVDVLTCTILVLTKVSSAPLSLQPFDIANILGFYAFSFPPLQVFSISFWACTVPSYIKDMPLYPFNMSKWTATSIIQLTCAETVIYIPNMAKQ